MASTEKSRHISRNTILYRIPSIWALSLWLSMSGASVSAENPKGDNKPKDKTEVLSKSKSFARGKEFVELIVNGPDSIMIGNTVIAKPRVHINTVSLKTLNDLNNVQYRAGYDAHAHVIELSVFEILSKNNGTIDYKILQDLVKMNNDMLHITYEHELWHAILNKSLSKLGQSPAQVIQTNIYHEIACRVREMVVRRGIYLQTGSLADAFIGSDVRSGHYEIANVSSSMKKYRDWLKKNKNITNEITQDEADILIQVGIALLEEKFDRYHQEFFESGMESYKVNANIYNFFKKTKKSPDDQNLMSFDTSVLAAFNFFDYGVNPLALASDKQTNLLIKSVEKFMKDPKYLGGDIEKVIAYLSKLSPDGFREFANHHNLSFDNKFDVMPILFEPAMTTQNVATKMDQSGGR